MRTTRASAYVLHSIVLSALAAIGCGSTALHPRLATDGLHAAREQFVVDYAVPAQRRLAGSAWSLDNFYEDMHATKIGGDYRVRLRLDSDGNGRAEIDQDEDLYEARLVYRSTGTTLWLRTLPVERALGVRDLEALAQSYADAVTGGTYVAVDFGTVVRDRRFATQITRSTACTWDGIPAYAIDFTVRDVDRAQIGVTDPDWLVSIVLAHAPRPWMSGRYDYPAILVAGLAGRPRDAAQSAPAFAGLLSAVRIRNAQGGERPRGTTDCPTGPGPTAPSP